MRLSILGLLGLLASQSVAAPGGHCDRYEYKHMCPRCPWNPHHPRELEGGLEERGRHKVCYKDCPRAWQQCKHWDKRDGGDHYDDNDDEKYWLDYSQDFSCPHEFKFKVVVKIEESSGEQYLSVNQNYQGGGDNDRLLMEKRGRIGISHSRLGVYKSHGSEYDPGNLNYNNYCDGNACSVPVKNLPGYPYLCNTEIFLAVGNDGCYDGYGRNEHGYHQGTKYVKVTVRCNEKRRKNRHCREYCCCPH